MGPLVQEIPALKRLRELARDVDATPALGRLFRLCGTSSETRFPFALVTFVSNREILSILADWSNDNIHCEGLLQLGQACWSARDLVSQIRPFASDQHVGEMFRGHIEEQYLASMAASRRALPTGATSDWLQILRAYILVRALDALDAEVRREAHLLEVCRTLRFVCEITNHDRRRWIEAISGSARSFGEFEAETLIQCRQARHSFPEKTAEPFFRCLIHILEHRPWKEVPGSHTTQDDTWSDPYPSARQSESDSVAEPTLHSEMNVAVRLADTEITVQATNPLDSDSKRRFNGDKLRLEKLERHLYLPHSWHHVSDHERDEVLARSQELLRSVSQIDKFGAAVTQLAVLISQTMNDVSKVKFGETSEPDWRLSLKRKSIHKLAPRFNKRWVAGKETGITPVGEVWEYELADAVAAPILEAFRKKRDAREIDDLWQTLTPAKTLVDWFNSVFAEQPPLSRLSGPNTATILPLQIYSRSEDHATTRLLASDHRTALPAACAYGSYGSSEVRSLLQSDVTAGIAQILLPRIGPERNIAGSELDISLPILRKQIANLRTRVNQAAAQGPWWEYHNLLTAYTVLTLLASTGARPVNSPFESIAWIDLNRGLVFVQDKVSGPTQGARICVLSDVAVELLRQVFFPHLQRLATALETVSAEFSAEMKRALQPDSDSRLPLFFFMRAEPTLDWLEVTESQLSKICHFEPAWPWNLFRHLSSTQLRRRGLPPDIRDALLGHAEKDAESHGDFSSRVPLEDLEVARPIVNSLQVDLGLALPDLAAVPINIPRSIKVEGDILQSQRKFGRRARASQRQAAHELARTVAKSEIETFLAGRTIEQLSSESLEELGRQMLLRRGGLPHSMGSLRYEIFEEFVSKQWRSRRRHARLTSRYVLIEEGRQIFDERALTAHETLHAFEKAFEEFAEARRQTNEAPVISAAMAAIDLILYSRLAHFPMLRAVLCNDKSIQLVRFQSRHWLEWGYGAVWQDGKPVLRVEITARAFHWIYLAIQGRASSRVPPLPKAMSSLGGRLPEKHKSLENMVRDLVDLQSQKNSLELSGYFAAYLAGRRPSSGLPHVDWIRVTTRAAPIVSTTAEDQVDQATDSEAHKFFRHHYAAAAKLDDAALIRCGALFENVRNTLTSGDSNSKMVSQIARHVKASGFVRGDAPFLLCHFMIHVLTRKSKRGSRDYLRASTALRYWYSLAGPILSVASGDNWLDAEEDDITEAYSQIVFAMEPDLPHAAFPSSGQPAPIELENPEELKASRASDAASRTLLRLREFHGFARTTYGLPDPDWSEISSDEVVGVGRPGLVLIEEYLVALPRLLQGKSPSELDEDTLAAAFVLIVCARFGLRLGEAVGLLRSDWIDVSGTLTVLVVTNAIRTLKTDNAKRRVPQLEDITDLEKEILKQTLEQWIHREGRNQKTPLLAGISRENFKAKKGAIANRLLLVLKRTTKSDSSTLHGLRHGFAMRILALLEGRSLISGTTPSKLDVEKARRLLLCSAKLDRRALWAVARLLGHAGPGVTIRSYINCIHLWLPPVIQQSVSGIPAPSFSAIDLDKLKVEADYLTKDQAEPVELTAIPAPLITRALRFLRLLAIGQPVVRAQASSKLADQDVTRLTLILTAASEKLTPSENRFMSFQILSGIPLTRLTQLLSSIGTAESGHKLSTPLNDWLDTIGSSRQIVLFQEAHFRSMAEFVSTMKLTKADVQLVSRNKVHSKIGEFLHANGLTEFVKPKGEMTPSFQLDVARFGPTNLVAPERVVAVVRPGGQLSSSFELLLFWLLWIFIIESQNLHLNPDQGEVSSGAIADEKSRSVR